MLVIELTITIKCPSRSGAWGLPLGSIPSRCDLRSHDEESKIRQPSVRWQLHNPENYIEAVEKLSYASLIVN